MSEEAVMRRKVYQKICRGILHEHVFLTILMDIVMSTPKYDISIDKCGKYGCDNLLYLGHASKRYYIKWSIEMHLYDELFEDIDKLNISGSITMNGSLVESDIIRKYYINFLKNIEPYMHKIYDIIRKSYLNGKIIYLNIEIKNDDNDIEMKLEAYNEETSTRNRIWVDLNYSSRYYDIISFEQEKSRILTHIGDDIYYKTKNIDNIIIDIYLNEIMILYESLKLLNRLNKISLYLWV